MLNNEMKKKKKNNRLNQTMKYACIGCAVITGVSFIPAIIRFGSTGIKGGITAGSTFAAISICCSDLIIFY